MIIMEDLWPNHDYQRYGREKLPHSASGEGLMMETRNLAKNILYRICTELVRRDQCRALEMEAILRMFPDLPRENINESVRWLVSRRWLREDKKRARVHLTESGFSAIRALVPQALLQDCLPHESCHRQR
jgi:hypothetical protein